MTTNRAWMMGAIALAACATSQQRKVDNENLSVAGHQQEAAREKADAQKELSRYSPSDVHVAKAVPVGDTPGVDYIEGYSYNPTDWALDDAQRHLRHAKQHEAAASKLEKFEDAECKGLTPKARAACPMLGPVARVENRANGVRIVFEPGTDVGVVVAHMRCHLAFARARAYADGAECPLYMRGIDISASPDGSGVDVTSREHATVRAIQNQARVVSIPRAGATL